MLVAISLATLTPPALARDSLGMYAGWGAFRDPQVPRCYAISKAIPSKLHRDHEPYASVGTWPKRGVRGQLYFRLSREMAQGSSITLRIGSQRFALTGNRANAWANGKAMDAAIVAAMRSAESMTVAARDTSGKGFSNTWPLTGAASAMDAASLGCAKLR